MKIRPIRVMAGATFFLLAGCTSYEGSKELLMGGEGLTHNFEGEVMENLIRASKGMAFIHYDVSNFQSLITQKVIPNIGTSKSVVYNSFPKGVSTQTTTTTGKSPTTQVTDTIGASVSALSQSLTKGTTLGLSGERDNAGTLNMVPIYDEKAVYQAYVTFLNIDRNDAKIEDEARSLIESCDDDARKLWEDIRQCDAAGEAGKEKLPDDDLKKFSNHIQRLYGYRNVKLAQTELKKLVTEFADVTSVRNEIQNATGGKMKPAEKDSGGDQALKISQVTTVKRDKERSEIANDELAAKLRYQSASDAAAILNTAAARAKNDAEKAAKAASDAESAVAQAKQESSPKLLDLTKNAEQARALATSAQAAAETTSKNAKEGQKIMEEMAKTLKPEAFSTSYKSTETVKQPASDTTPPHLFMPPVGKKFDVSLHPLEGPESTVKAGTYVPGAKMKWNDGWYYVPIQYQSQFSDLCLALVARSPGGSGGTAAASTTSGKKQSKAATDNAANFQQQNAFNVLENR